MFVNTFVLVAPLLLFSFVFFGSNAQAQDCQSFSTCENSCSWDSCCTKLDCTNCDHAFSCEIEIITGSVSWCTVQANDTLTPSLINTINITFESSNDCTSCTNGETMCCGSDEYTVIPKHCSTVSTYSALKSSSQSSNVYRDTTLITSSLVILAFSSQSSDVYSDTALISSSLVTLTSSSQSSDVYSDTALTTSTSVVTPPDSSVPQMGTHLLLTHSHFTTSTINTVSITTSVLATVNIVSIATSVPATPSSSVPVTSTIISIVVSAVVGIALLCLMVAAVFGSILALVLCKTKGKQFQVTNNSDPMSQQSTLDREETTTEIPHHLNIPALPTYSSLADVQQNTSNIEDLPLNYDVVRLENMSGSKIGVIDPYSSLAEGTSNVKELPLNYDIVRLENMSENKTGVIAQDSAEFIRVQPAPVYSTVVRQNGKKMTVKLDTPNILVEEKNEE